MTFKAGDRVRTYDGLGWIDFVVGVHARVVLDLPSPTHGGMTVVIETRDAAFYSLTEARLYCKSLGSTKEEVASSLRDQHITGVRKDMRGCPLFHSIRKNDPTFDWKDVLPVHFPGPPGEFILAFDRGEFPFLEAVS